MRFYFSRNSFYRTKVAHGPTDGHGDNNTVIGRDAQELVELVFKHLVHSGKGGAQANGATGQ